MDTVLVFRRGRLLSWNVPRAAVTGLDSSADAARKIEQYLQRKRFTTSLSDPAFKTMHDSASREWDSLASMKIDMLNLENCPDIFYVRLLVNKLRTVPRSNEAIAFVDALANEDRFACLTRNAQMVLGDLYARLGEADKAVVWYRKAGVPASRIAELQAARTMFTDGKMSGRLTHNGKPLSGARVGLAPFGIMREAVTLMLSPGVVRPYWFRWIGPTARTDSEGRFEITNIVAGEYRLLAAHPEVQFRPLDPSIRASGVPGRLFVGFGRPETRLGEIGIITNAETTQMSGAPSPP